MSTRNQQKEKRREQILLAGLDRFVKKGYASTKTSDIARAVNMSDGLFYRHSRENLMLVAGRSSKCEFLYSDGSGSAKQHDFGED